MNLLTALSTAQKISATTVRNDFNDLTAVVHYTRAAHKLGLWRSERLLIERYFADREAPLIEAGCGAGDSGVGCHTSREYLRRKSLD